ncbi:hypothetical protein GCAAIG_11270 [Candidatus Electronema halotolerans]
MKRRPVPPVPTPRTPPQRRPAKPKPEVQKGEISSVGQIFADAFSLYKRRILHLTGVMLLGYLFTGLVLAGLGFGAYSGLGLNWPQLQQFFTNEVQQIIADPQQLMTHPLALPLLGAGAVMLLAAFLLVCWVYTAALAAAVDEHQGIIEALCTGWKYLLPMLWISSLYVGILMTASIFFLLPGLILSLSMFFWFYVMIDEDRTGLDALMASRLYVRGHWWNTFFKMLLAWLAVMALNVPLGLLPHFVPFPGQQIVIQVLSFFISLFFICYAVVVYRDLKQAAGRIDPDSTCRCLWMPMALFGIMLPLLGLIGAFVAAGPKMPGELQHIREEFLRQLRQAAEQRGLNIPLPPPETAAPAPESDMPPQVQVLPAVDGFIIWRDPAGDTRNPLLDIREVSAQGQENELELTVTLAKPLADYFAAENRGDFDSLITFYFDTDMNPASGAALPDAADRTGYDLELDLLLAAPDGAGQAYASLYAIRPQQRQSLEPLADGAVSLADSSIRIRLPYSRFDAASGSTLRVCFREADQQEGSGLADDQTVPLQ